MLETWQAEVNSEKALNRADGSRETEEDIPELENLNTVRNKEERLKENTE
jgi:hypothetical protein